jgi:hypothetical protein
MITSAEQQARFQVPADVLFQNLGEEGIALKLASGKYYGFDEIATRMWTLLVAGASVPQALDTLSAEYDVAQPQLAHDLDAFIERLVRDGLLATQG